MDRRKEDHKAGSNRKGRKTSTYSSSVSRDRSPVPNIWTCLACDGAIDMEDFESIECFSCKEWCHRRCCELDREEFRVAQKGSSSLNYTCQNCLKKRGQAQWEAEKSRLEVQMEKMLDFVGTFTVKLSTIDEEKKLLDKRVEKVEGMIETEVDKKVREVFEEQKDKEMRKQNAVIFNIPESSNPDIEERQKEDTEEVLKVLEEVMDEKVAASEFDVPVRLGTRQIGKYSKPRVLRITLANEAFRKKLFSKTKKFNDRKGPRDRVYVNPDRTMKEREEYKKLKTELQEIQKKDPKSEYVIQRGKIVKKKQSDNVQENVSNVDNQSSKQAKTKTDMKRKSPGEETSTQVKRLRSIEDDRKEDDEEEAMDELGNEEEGNSSDEEST